MGASDPTRDYARYRCREVRPHGLREVRGYRLKVYSIVYAAPDLDWARFEAGLAMAFDELPEPAATGGRPGAGFVILHQGNGADYIVLCWWDRENELPTRVFVRPQTDGGAWRTGSARESFCVWDLEVIWFEREAWVRTALGDPDRGGLDAYLSTWLPPGSRPNAPQGG